MAGRSDASVKRLTLVACILGSGIVLLDGTVVNVALPTIQRALGGGLAAQQWVVNGYLLTLGSLILIGGSLGDLFGERRVFALGVGGFGVASLICALAPSIGVLVAARALQGVAGALLVPSSLAVIVNTFPEDERGAGDRQLDGVGGDRGRARAAGRRRAAGDRLVALDLPRSTCRWRRACVCADPVRRSRRCAARERGARRVDCPGALLCALGLGGPGVRADRAAAAGLVEPGGDRPADRRRGAARRVHCSTSRARRDPMLPLGLFRRRNFSAGNVETFAMYAGLAILFFFLVLFLQQIGGYSPLKSGLATLPVTVVMFVLSRRFGALADRFGPRFFMGAGPAGRRRGPAAVPAHRDAQVDYVSRSAAGRCWCSRSGCR